MNDGSVPDSTRVTNSKGRVHVHVQRAVILDIRVVADDDGRAISAYHGVVPDAGAFVDGNIADDHRTGGNKYIICNGWPNTVIRENWHALLLLDNAFQTPHDFIQLWTIVLIGTIEAVDGHTVVVLPLRVNKLGVVERHSHVRNILATKEDQVAFPHFFACHAVCQEIMLLVGIAWENIAAHAVTELYKTAAVQSLPACAAPQVWYSKKGSRVACYHHSGRAGVDLS